MDNVNSVSENLATSFIHLIKDMNTPALLSGPRSRVGKIIRPSVSSELSDLTSSGMVDDIFDISDPLPKGAQVAQEADEFVENEDSSMDFPVHGPLASVDMLLDINLGGFNPLAYLGGGDKLSDLPTNPQPSSGQGTPRAEKPIPIPGTVQYKDPRAVHDMLNELKSLEL